MLPVPRDLFCLLEEYYVTLLQPIHGDLPFPCGLGTWNEIVPVLKPYTVEVLHDVLVKFNYLIRVGRDSIPSCWFSPVITA